MAAIAHGLEAVTWTASTAAAGYPAANLGIARVRRPWRSTSLATTTVTIDLGASAARDPTVVIMGANIAAAAVQVHTSPNGSTWTARTNMAVVTGVSGVRKGQWRHGSSLTYRYIRLTITGATTDGAAFFSIGYGQVFAQRQALAQPLYGAEPRVVFPDWRATLPNGQTLQADAGEPYTEVRLPWRQSGGARAIEAFGELARNAPVLLDLELPDRTGWWWVVRNHQAQMARAVAGHNRETTSLTLTEQV